MTSAIPFDLDAITETMRVLSNPHRLAVVCLLREGEFSVTEMNSVITISQAALSQHLTRLRKAGIVTYRSASQVNYYRINDQRVFALLDTLAAVCPKPVDTDSK